MNPPLLKFLSLWTAAISLISSFQAMATPATPTINSPQTGQILTGTPIEFVWNAVDTANAYDFFLYDRITRSTAERVNQLSATNICDSEGLCRYLSTAVLSEGINHVWRVRSKNSDGASSWSYTDFDLLLSAPPDAPEPLAPSDNAILNASNPVTFTWSAVAAAAFFELLVFDRQTNEVILRDTDLLAENLCHETDCHYTPALDLSVGTGHVWRIRSHNASGSSNWTYTAFDYLGDAPDTPEILSPSPDQRYLPEETISFSWLEEPDASHYELLIYDRAVGSVVYRENGLASAEVCASPAACSITPGIPLSIANNHIWRVRAHGASGSSDWSYTSFDISPAAPATPVALFPGAGETVLSIEPLEYRWSASENATHYEFYLFDRDNNTVVSREYNLNASDVCQGITICRFTPSYTLPEADGNVWRVRAKNGAGNSSWTYNAFSTLVQRQTPALTEYQLVFSDEFQGSTLDENKWRTTHLWGPYTTTNNEEQLYIDMLDWHQGFAVTPIEVNEGNLIIRAIDNRDHSIPGPVQPEESDPIWEEYPEFRYNDAYTASEVDFYSGIISSYDSFRFASGYIEARAKIPEGQGLWSAFWLLSAFYVEDIPEIDIVEALGQFPDTVYHTYHYFDTSDEWQLYSTPTYETTGSDFTADFHEYAVSWDHEKIIWYVDGLERYRISTLEYPIPTQSMYVLANLAVGGNWPGSPDSTTPFPAELIIDYIRVYQKTPPDAITPTVLQNEFDLVFSDEFNGDTLDTEKWNTAFLWGPYLQINNEQQIYPDVHGMHQDYPINPFTVDNGVLSIRAEPVDEIDLPETYAADADVWSDYPSYRFNSAYGAEWIPSYTSGLITSYDAFKFVDGYVEIRARLPQGDGAWPALWLLNGYYVGNLPEIDIVELNGAFPDAAHQTYHYSDTSGNVISSPLVVDGGLGPDGYSADFHTYGVHWSPERIDWYIDGVKTRTLENEHISNQLMYVIANFAVGGNFVGEIDSADYPATMDIDYIRVYRLSSD